MDLERKENSPHYEGQVKMIFNDLKPLLRVIPALLAGAASRELLHGNPDNALLLGCLGVFVLSFALSPNKTPFLKEDPNSPNEIIS